MSECNTIIEANNEIYRLKKENKKLNALCVKYGFEMGGLEEENKQLKQTIKTIKEICNQHKIPNLLTTYIPVNCEKRKGCLNNHMTNANNMGKSNLAKEILELI